MKPPHLNRKFPAQPELMKSRTKRMIEDARKKEAFLHSIPPIFASECEMVLHAYYGGTWKTIWHLTRKAAYLGYHSTRGKILLMITDGLGWTKLYEFPAPNPHKIKLRHGRKCSGSPNCDNVHCIEDSIPAWFQKLTGWNK